MGEGDRVTRTTRFSRRGVGSHYLDVTGFGRNLQPDRATDLRERYGELIGEIAASHWWDIEQVAERFSTREPIGAPIDCPDDWTVDELQLVCLMRVSDAAHLDERRAPGFLRAVRNPTGYSDLHWAFQGYLQRPRRADDSWVTPRPEPLMWRMRKPGGCVLSHFRWWTENCEALTHCLLTEARLVWLYAG